MKQYIYITLYISAITIGQVYGMELIPAKQNDFIKDKLVNKKSYSIEDWKKYQFLLMDSRGFIDNPCERKKRTQMIKKTRKIITLKERELDLKAMVSYIRQTKTTDIDDLRAYKTKLEMFVQKLPESSLQRAPYHETILLVTQRINLLDQIDMNLEKDYNSLDINDLNIIIDDLSELQKKLNKPNSERHQQLTAKIEHIKKLMGHEIDHESLVNRMLFLIKL